MTSAADDDDADCRAATHCLSSAIQSDLRWTFMHMLAAHRQSRLFWTAPEAKHALGPLTRQSVVLRCIKKFRTPLLSIKSSPFTTINPILICHIVEDSMDEKDSSGRNFLPPTATQTSESNKLAVCHHLDTASGHSSQQSQQHQQPMLPCLNFNNGPTAASYQGQQQQHQHFQSLLHHFASRMGLEPTQLLGKVIGPVEAQQQLSTTPAMAAAYQQQQHQQQQWLIAQLMVANNKLTAESLATAMGKHSMPAAGGHHHPEELCDSGNETSSLSPGHTPMTASSPHSLPSRSNSFSVSSILRTNISMTSSKSEQKKLEIDAKSTIVKSTSDNSSSSNISSFDSSSIHDSAQSTPIFMPMPKRVPFFPVVEQQQNQHSNGGPLQLAVPRAAPPPPQQQQPSNFSWPPPLPFGVLHPPRSATAGGQQPHFVQQHNTQFPPLPHAQLQHMQFLLGNPAAMLAFLQHQQQHQQLMQATAGEFCVVCGDRASGHHYGVLSCEGCKGFFRRTVQGNTNLQECLKNRQCVFDRNTRNRCQKCRFEKCLQMGMQKTHVRMDKNRKRKSELDQREVLLESMRQNIELTRAIADGFKRAFLNPSVADQKEEQQLTLPLNIVPITSLGAGHEFLCKFLSSVGVFKDLPPADREFLLSKRIHAVLLMLAVFSDRPEMTRQFGLSADQFEQLRNIFWGANRPFSLEEASLLMACALTSERRTEAVEKLHVWLWKCVQEQIVDRNGDDENIDPVEICLNLMRVLARF